MDAANVCAQNETYAATYLASYFQYWQIYKIDGLWLNIRHLIRELMTELAYMKMVLDLILWARMKSATHSQDQIRKYYKRATPEDIAKAESLLERQKSELQISKILETMRHEVVTLLANYKNLVILIAGTTMYKPRNLLNGQSRGRTEAHKRSLTDSRIALFPAAAIWTDLVWTEPKVVQRAENREVIPRSVTIDSVSCAVPILFS